MEYNTKIDREILFTSLDVKEGTADPAAARKLMQYFCEFHDSGDIPYWLLLHFRDCFDAILKGKISVEQALGLNRRRRGSADHTKKTDAAKTFLELRLAGNKWDEARKETASRHNISKSAAEKCLRDYRTFALDSINNERGESYEWTHSERRILKRLFVLHPIFLTPL